MIGFMFFVFCVLFIIAFYWAVLAFLYPGPFETRLQSVKSAFMFWKEI